MRKHYLLLAIVALMALTGLAACGGSSKDEGASTSSSSSSQNASTEGAKKASVEFIKPVDGSTLGDRVSATVKISGFTIDAKDVGMANVPGKGHVHFSMDGGKYDYPKYSGANGQLAMKLGVEGKYSPSVTPSITYSNLPPGEHTLEVYLVNNDHSDTGTKATTSFMVR